MDGNLSEMDARLHAQPLLSLFENLPNFELTTVANDTLAYQIKKRLVAHRYILKFVLEDTEVLKKFRELSALNKSLLRHLVINIEKDYGYKATVNTKKVKFANTQKEKYKKYMEAKAQKIQKPI